MGDTSDAGPARRSVSLVPGVVYEWTPDGDAPVVVAEPIEAREPTPDLAPGVEVVAGYRLVGRLGAGQAGEVWRAIGPGGAAVALKFVEVGRPGGWQELAALATMLEVRHANLVGLFGIWEHHDRAVIGMDLADGSLLDRSAAGMGFAELVDCFRQAARGIDFLNEPRHAWAGAGPFALIHRDIKPANLLLVGGSVKVGDFGLVARLGDHEPGDHDGAADAEPASPITAFTAPEVRRGGLSAQADQYSLAACYCHLRGGRAADGSGPDAAVDPGVLPEAERPAVARALADDPAARWPSCSAFVEALAASAEAAQAAPGPTHRGWALLGLLAGVAAAAATLLTWHRPGRPPGAGAQPPAPTVAARPVEAPPDPVPIVRVESVAETAAIGPAERPPAATESPTAATEPAPEALAAEEDAPAPATDPAGPDVEEVAAWLRARARAAVDRLGGRLASARSWAERLPRPTPTPAATPAPIAAESSRDPEPAPVAATRPAEPPGPRTATVIVRMPTTRAELVVRGEVGRGNPDEWYGPRRIIHTPPIDAPRDYLVGAFWMEPGDRPATRSVALKVQPGRRYEVDLRAATPTATEVKDPPSP